MRSGGDVTPVGLRPPFVTPPPPSLILIDAESHLDCCRAVLPHMWNSPVGKVLFAALVRGSADEWSSFFDGAAYLVAPVGCLATDGFRASAGEHSVENGDADRSFCLLSEE